MRCCTRDTLVTEDLLRLSSSPYLHLVGPPRRTPTRSCGSPAEEAFAMPKCETGIKQQGALRKLYMHARGHHFNTPRTFQQDAKLLQKCTCFPSCRKKGAHFLWKEPGSHHERTSSPVGNYHQRFPCHPPYHPSYCCQPRSSSCLRLPLALPLCEGG